MKGAVSSPRTFNVNPSSAWNLAQVFMSLRIYQQFRGSTKSFHDTVEAPSC